MQNRASTRLALAGSALFGLSCLIAWQHREVDEGLRAQDIAEATIEAELAEGQDGRQLLLDLVEPEDGEGGSEAELKALIDSLGLRAEPAGFYAESEHLWRIHGSPRQLAALQRALVDHPKANLIEGVEADLTYSVPAHALTAWSSDEGQGQDDADAQRPDRPRFVPNDPMYPLQWHLDAIHSPEAWMHTRGRGAIVAVIDTGVAYKDFEHRGVVAKAVPDLAGVEMVAGKSFVANGLPDGLDDHAHGTHVAGTIAQATDNGIGVAGVANQATIMPLKVLAANGGGSVADISNAIRYAADSGANVINMSLGGPLPSRVMAKAVEYAHDKGVTVICAAGNERRSRISYPAAYKGSVAVAATGKEGKRSFYSNWGKELDISAPGGDQSNGKEGGVLQNTIMVGDPAHNDYLWFQGTSMASPHAAGVAGLIVASGVDNPKEVERILKQTAHHPNNVEWDKEYGAGIIDAEAAVIAARSSYQGERMGLAGLLGLLGLLALPLGAGRGQGGDAPKPGPTSRLLTVAGLGGGVALSAGLFVTPLAYTAGTATGLLGSGLFLSALLPTVLTLLLLQVKSLRGLLAGLSLGWSALLLHGAIVLPTLLDGIPGGAGWDRLWLGANALLALALAYRVGLGERNTR